MNEFVTRLKDSVPQLIAGILLLIITLALAYLAKFVVSRIYQSSKLDERLKPHTEDASIGDMLGTLAFVLVLLFFLPGILSSLGLNFISTPILGMLNGVYNYIPNLIGATIVLIFGFIVAKLIKDFSTLFFRKAGVDAYQEKLGITKTGGSSVKLSEGIGKLLYALVLIPIIISALKILNISVISEPAIAMLNDIFKMIPLILAAIVVLVIGVFIAKLAADLIYSLTSVSGISDRLAETMEDSSPYKFDLSKIVSEFVRYLIIAIFAVQAMNILKLDLLNRTGSMILAYIPKILSAIIILVGGYILSALAKKFIKNNFPDGVFPGVIAKWIIMALASLAALNQLGIATEFIMPLYVFTIAALAVAGALAFGLGGRDFASKQLSKLDNNLNDGIALEETKNRIVSKEEERDRNLESEFMSAKAEYNKRIEEAKEELRKKQEEFENAKRKIEEEIENERRRKEEEERRREEERQRIIEEEKRRIEEEKRRIEEEKRKREEERLRREEERRIKEEEDRKRREEERLRREEERLLRERERREKELAKNEAESKDNITVSPEIPTVVNNDTSDSSKEFKRDFVKKDTAGYEVKTVNDPHNDDLRKSTTEESKEAQTNTESTNTESNRIINDVNKGEEALLDDEKKKF